MGNEIIQKTYFEYKKINSFLINKYDFNVEENENNISIIVTNPSLDIIKKLSDICDYFEIDCNPFSYECDDVIDQIEREILTLDSIDNITISYDKCNFTEIVEYIDYVFFEMRPAIDNLKVIPNESNLKLNIILPGIIRVETVLCNFIGLEFINDVCDLQRKIIDPAIIIKLMFYLDNMKKATGNFYYNPYAFIITFVSEQEDMKFINSIKREFYLVMLEALSDKKVPSGFIIRGHKNINIIEEDEFSVVNYDEFKSIFEFLVSEHRFTEKYIIIKKVLTLYYRDSFTFSYLDSKFSDIHKTILYYYDHYIEDDLKEFF